MDYERTESNEKIALEVGVNDRQLLERSVGVWVPVDAVPASWVPVVVD